MHSIKRVWIKYKIIGEWITSITVSLTHIHTNCACTVEIKKKKTVQKGQSIELTFDWIWSVSVKISCIIIECNCETIVLKRTHFLHKW